MTVNPISAPSPLVSAELAGGCCGASRAQAQGAAGEAMPDGCADGTDPKSGSRLYDYGLNPADLTEE